MNSDFNYNEENLNRNETFNPLNAVGSVVRGMTNIVSDVLGVGGRMSPMDIDMNPDMNPDMIKKMLSSIIPKGSDIDVNTALGRNAIYNIIEYAYIFAENPVVDPNDPNDPLNTLGVSDYAPLNPKQLVAAIKFLKKMFPILDLSNSEQRKLAYADIEVRLQGGIDVSNPDTIQEQITKVFETILTPVDSYRRTSDLIDDPIYRQRVYEEMERQLITVSSSRTKRRITAFISKLFPLKDLTNVDHRVDIYNKLEDIFRKGKTVDVVGRIPLPGYNSEINSKLDLYDNYLHELEGSIDGVNDKLKGSIDGVNDRLKGSIENVNDKIKKNIDLIDYKIDAVDGKLKGSVDDMNYKIGEVDDKFSRTIDGMEGMIDYINDYSEKFNTKLIATDTLISEVDLKLQKDFTNILDTVNEESIKSSALYDEILSELRLNKSDIDDNVDNIKMLIQKFDEMMKHTSSEVYQSMNELKTNNDITMDTVGKLSDKIKQQTAVLDTIKLQVFEGFDKAVHKHDYEETINDIIELDKQNKKLHGEIISLENEMLGYTEKINNVNHMVEENVPMLAQTLTRFSSEVENQYDALENDVIYINETLHETIKNIDETYGDRIQSNSDYINMYKVFVLLVFCAMLYVAYAIYNRPNYQSVSALKGGQAFHKSSVCDRPSSLGLLR